jgi:hypothetical protein
MDHEVQHMFSGGHGGVAAAFGLDQLSETKGLLRPILIRRRTAISERVGCILSGKQ